MIFLYANIYAVLYWLSSDLTFCVLLTIILYLHKYVRNNTSFTETVLLHSSFASVFSLQIYYLRHLFVQKNFKYTVWRTLHNYYPMIDFSLWFPCSGNFANPHFERCLLSVCCISHCKFRMLKLQIDVCTFIHFFIYLMIVLSMQVFFVGR